MEKKEGTSKKGSGLQRKRGNFLEKNEIPELNSFIPLPFPPFFFDGLASGMFKKSQRGEFIVSFKEMKETPFWSIGLGSLARSAYEK